MSPLHQLIQQHKAGKPCAIYAVCSANSFVLEASILQARDNHSLLLIEATSNQVNQFGGYTGMTPDDFKHFVESMAVRLNFPLSQLILGGDHLGPNCWQNEDAASAMLKSKALIAAYVKAGFEKIHLDCSMPCADDNLPLSDTIIAQRAAQLCEVAEQTYNDPANDIKHAPLYVIGTEVPVPGGAQEDLETSLQVTSAQDANNTLTLHREIFAASGLGQAWQRTIALVVQPGVEFDHQSVIRFQPQKTQQLRQMINDDQHLVFEAHSTDYQAAAAYTQLVENHFVILKVGPALTFAFREALFSLSAIEDLLIDEEKRSKLKQTLDTEMLAAPKYWESYYTGSETEKHFSRQFSLSDRCRYYWPNPSVNTAVNTLIENLSKTTIPISLISQHLPQQFKALTDNKIENNPLSFIYYQIQLVTAAYAAACNMEPKI